MEIIKESIQISEIVLKTLKYRLIHQFRNEKWGKIIKEEIQNSIKHIVDEKGYNQGFSDGMDKMEKYFTKNYIPKPTPNLKTKIKFLISGKF